MQPTDPVPANPSHHTVLQLGDDGCRQFLHSWAAWRDEGVTTRLHYLLLAPHCTAPVSTDADLASQLAAAWPPLTPGYHRLLLAQGRVVLTLVVGDVLPALAQLEAQVDRFLLQDETLCTAALFKRLARLAAPAARLQLAPHALAQHAQVLQQAGFVVDAQDVQDVRFAPRWTIPVPALPPRRAIVIGAGLAGSTACERLAARGWQVTLVERHAQPAQEASGNLAGVYMPAISRDDNPTARLTRAAFLFARQLWAQHAVFAPGRDIGAACGVLQVARDAAQAEAFEQATRHWRYPSGYAQWLSAEAASARLGQPTGSGWYFPAGGWLRPGKLCEAMLQACGAQLQRRFARQALQLQRHDGQWQVLDDDGLIAQAPVLILANGIQSLQLPAAAGLPLQAIRGQVSHVPAAQLPLLPLALCGDGYVAGAVDGLVSVGASYDQDDDPALRSDSHAGNLDKLAQLLPAWRERIAAMAPATLGGRVGFRCVSADRLPLAGALPDLAALAQAGEVQLKELPRHPQLYGLLAYASRGLIWAPLAAEIVACQLNGEPAPLGRDLLALLDPGRFALKAHRRQT